MRKIVSLLLCLSMVFALSACGGGGDAGTNSESPAPGQSEPAPSQSESAAPGGSEPAQPETRTVTDMNGDTVEFQADGDIRIMTCVAVNTMAVLMLGGTDAVATLGQGFDYSEGSLNRSMFPGLDNVPPATRDSANAEEVAVINPTVVLSDVPDTIDALRQVGIPAAYLTVISSDTLIEAVKLVGDILGGDAAQEASEYAEYYQGLIDDTTALTKDLTDDQRPLVYYGRIENGTAGLNSIPDFWIQACGGVNVASKIGLEGSRVEISDEALLEQNPDIIITETPELAEIFRTSEKYAGLDAVKNGKVYCNPAGWSMGSMESALQMVWAPMVIQPDLFPDNDVEAATRDFYERFYDYTLSDSELAAIVYPDQSAD